MILTTIRTSRRETFGSNARCGAREKCDISHAVAAKEIEIKTTITRNSNTMTTHRVRVILSMSTRSPTWQRSKNLSVSFSFGAVHLPSSAPPYNWFRSLKMCSKRLRFRAAWSHHSTPLIKKKWSVRRTLNALFSLTINTNAAGTYGLAFSWSIPVSLCHWE